MLKLLKWIYRQGQLNERQRIRTMIVEFSAHTDSRRREFEIYMPEMDRKHRRITDQDLEVDRRVRQVLERVLEPEFMREYSAAPIDKDSQ